VNETLGLESSLVVAPFLLRLASTPVKFLAATFVMTSPQCSVALVETNDVLDSFKRSPSNPRRALVQLVTQRAPVQGVGRRGVRVERASIKDSDLALRAGADQNVIVQVGLAVSIKSVRETHYPLPLGGDVLIVAPRSVAHE
jgi:hypothetical protein